jgi:Uncharacterized protein conserved in bacteria (DUF2252)
MKHLILLSLLAGCGASVVNEASDESATLAEDLKVPSALQSKDFTQPLTKDSIRALQTWVDDATFELKWQAMLASPIEFFGASVSAYHHDLGSVPKKRFPGDEGLCHGDPKLDNFGWTLVDGAGVFSDNDFDDAGYCLVVGDALRFLVATNLWFDDPSLTSAALDAYAATIDNKHNAVPVDPATEPSWADVRTKGLAKATSADRLVLGGEVQIATPAESSAVRTLMQHDVRFPRAVLDVGSAGLRRFWALTEDAAAVRTILELKELTTPGTEFGRHSATLDGPDRFDVLKDAWWNAADPGYHFVVNLVGARFLVRDRLTRTNPKPDKLSHAELQQLLEAEASALALQHRAALDGVKPKKLQAWLGDSATAVTKRWRKTYAGAGGL